MTEDRLSDFKNDRPDSQTKRNVDWILNIREEFISKCRAAYLDGLQHMIAERVQIDGRRTKKQHSFSKQSEKRAQHSFIQKYQRNGQRITTTGEVKERQMFELARKLEDREFFSGSQVENGELKQRARS